jgi:adenosylhomocysteine nucleosidase
MGQNNARTAITEALTSFSPELVLTCGYAGGLNPRLQRGDVVFDAGSHGRLARRLIDLGAQAGTFHCTSQIAVSAAAKEQLRRESQADAVEMESGVIRTLCRQRGIPAATIRVISDDAATDLPLDFNRLLKTDGNISYARLAIAIARSPGAIRKLMQFQRELDMCSRRLASALEGLLGKAIS